MKKRAGQNIKLRPEKGEQSNTKNDRSLRKRGMRIAPNDIAFKKANSVTIGISAWAVRDWTAHIKQTMSDVIAS